MAFSPTFQYQPHTQDHMVKVILNLYEEPVSCHLCVKHILGATPVADDLWVNKVHRGQVGVHVKPFVELRML